MKQPSDLTTKQWNRIKHLFERENRGKHLRIHEKRKLVNAVLYIGDTGCHWRQLPRNFPKYTTVSSFYHRALKSGLWAKILAILAQETPDQANVKPKLNNAQIGTQDVGSTETEEYGEVDGKKNERIRSLFSDGHYMVNTVLTSI